MTDDDLDPTVEMQRYWFCVYDESPKFHASQTCHRLRDLPRAPQNLPVAHIPVDSNDVGSPSDLDFCEECGVANPFR